MTPPTPFHLLDTLPDREHPDVAAMTAVLTRLTPRELDTLATNLARALTAAHTGNHEALARFAAEARVSLLLRAAHEGNAHA